MDSSSVVVLSMVSQLREKTDLLYAFLCERIAIHSTVDYSFFLWYFYDVKKILKECEELLQCIE